MSNKPLSVADYLNKGLPQVVEPPGILLRNKYEVLSRDRSASAHRGASPRPQKRKKADSVDEMEGGGYGTEKPFESMADEEANFEKAKGIEKWIKESLDAATEEEISPRMKKILEGVVESGWG
jgi:hypothetical protein